MQLRILAIAMAAALAAGCVSNESKAQAACATAPATSTASTPAAESSAPITEEVPPVFVNLETFTVNLVAENGHEYLQAAISLEVENPQAQAAINDWMPKIRSSLTVLLSAEKSAELFSREGKKRLADSLKDEINSIIAPKKGKQTEVAPGGPVKSVLFTSFIIQ